MKVFFPGQNVPQWLGKQEPRGDKFKFGKFTFSGVCMVTKGQNNYCVRNIIGGGIVMTLANAESVNLILSAPQGCNGSLEINTKPILTWLEFVLSAALIVLAL